MHSSRHQMQPFIRRWPTGRPSLTALLVAISVAAAVGQWTFFLLDHNQTVAAESVRNWMGLTVGAITEGRPWQFLTFMFCHAGIFHLLGNMLLVYFAGREVEPIVGPRHLVGMYFLANVIGGLMQWAAMAAGLAPAETAFVGVSAGAMALLAAFSTLLPELDVTVYVFGVLPVQTRARYLGVAGMTIAAVLWATWTAPVLGPTAMLAGGMVGWAYVRQLGFGSPLAIQLYLYEKHQREARIRRMSPEQFIAMEIDPILDKIAREGIQSLTRAERKLLQRGREKITGNTVLPA